MRKYIVLSLFLLCFAILFLIAGEVVKLSSSQLPPMERLAEYRPSMVTRFYDLNGETIAEIYAERRTMVPLAKIPVDLQNAAISIEDRQFFHHWGLNLRGIARAMWVNLKARRVVQGGSSITQQLARDLFLTREITLKRKFLEALATLQLERKYTKEEILEIYLNQSWFGEGAYGVEAAAQIYFGKRVQDLNLSECAYLAGVLGAPARFSFFKNPENALIRRAIVLNCMAQLGFISKEEATEAKLIPFDTSRFKATLNRAPYFIEWLRQNLVEKYGYNLVYKGGLQVQTTLNLRLQEIAQKVLQEKLTWIDQQQLASADMEKSTTPVQGALVALDPKTGQVRAMAGGRDFSLSQFNRCVQAKRQPGSAFKPFVYTAALDKGYKATTTLQDSPVTYYQMGPKWELLCRTTDLSDLDIGVLEELDPEKIWAPENYHRDYHGPTPLRDALEHSRNVATINLLYELGPSIVADYAHRMGIQSPLDTTLALGLGCSVVTPLEITSAFATLANQGIRTKPYAILSIEDIHGNIIEQNQPEKKEIFSASTAYLVTHLLEGVIQHGTGRYAKYYLRRPVAGKTGTTNDFTDAWFIGFTPQLVCGVWVGYDDNRTLGKGMEGAKVACPIWTAFMKEALAGEPIEDFPVPSDIVFVKVDPYSGLLATEGCPDAYEEAFLKGTEPKTIFEEETE